MRVYKEVSLTTDVEIDISGDDICAALSGLDQAGACYVLNSVAKVLNGITDESIGKMTDSQRRITAEFFTTQAQRYKS